MTEKNELTEQEMRERIKEIDKIRDELTKEKREYERKLYDQERKNILEAHREFEGKYFMTMNYPKNTNKEIQAFKILRVLDEPNERYAECVALVDGYESNCWNVKAIKFMVLPVWCKNTNKMISNPSEPRMIDMYELVDEEDFLSLYNTYIQEINSKL